MYIHWLHKISEQEEMLVGGKGANLARLTRLGAPVPLGFCVSLRGYEYFIENTAASAALEKFLSEIDVSDIQQLTLKSLELQRLFLTTAMPAPISQDVSVAYQELGDTIDDPEPVVAVRSSATAEDMPNASFAGQYDSYLGVRGENALVEHIVRCWASLWNAHAIHYRRANRIGDRQVYMTVVVQQMVRATAAGVLFTANPLSGNHSEAVINSSWGLGEGVVSGSVVPDTYIISKASRAIVSRVISLKESMLEVGDGVGTKESPVPEDLREAPSLTNEQVQELLALGLTIEDQYGVPQDIEWAYRDGRFHILQSRPITGLGTSSAPPL